ncbi:hypothetical protein OVA12_05955 [Pannonibacter sp. SL95]|nr:hypothetical protein [Pannonibacter sp. SL95]MCY1705570.1 hypothetical protein [Pannonibacter sp. SL95]
MQGEHGKGEDAEDDRQGLGTQRGQVLHLATEDRRRAGQTEGWQTIARQQGIEQRRRAQLMPDDERIPHQPGGIGKDAERHQPAQRHKPVPQSGCSNNQGQEAQRDRERGRAKAETGGKHGEGEAGNDPAGQGRFAARNEGRGLRRLAAAKPRGEMLGHGKAEQGKGQGEQAEAHRDLPVFKTDPGNADEADDAGERRAGDWATRGRPERGVKGQRKQQQPLDADQQAECGDPRGRLRRHWCDHRRRIARQRQAGEVIQPQAIAKAEGEQQQHQERRNDGIAQRRCLTGEYKRDKQQANLDQTEPQA